MTIPSFTVCIGNARLYLGDAYAILPTLGRFDRLVMDPQYEFDNSGGGEYRAARGASDQIVEEGLDQGFDHTIINSLLFDAVVVFCHNDQLPKLLPYLDGNYHRTVVAFWAKPNPPPHRNKHYLADTEPYIHAWNRGHEPVGAHHDMHRFITAGSQPSKLYGHPTVKPEVVMDKIMTNVGGQSVCDPFMGTGSTGVAAIKAGKTFVGIEKNEKHFHTAVARIKEAHARQQEAA
ncbi:DNA methyltransferase [Sphingobium cupriresistens]|uniref:DNA methyltransferase n=1 Tax=Sphingobium cupriresistens TaxID=1132417 RepID=UPI003BADD944